MNKTKENKKILNAFFKKSFFRYSFNGLFLNILGYVTYLYITYINFEPKLAMTFTYLLTLIIGFYWHRNYTFFSSEVASSKFSYFIIHLTAYSGNLILLSVLVDIFEFKHQFVQGISIVLVAIYLYLMLNHFVYNREIKKIDSI